MSSDLTTPTRESPKSNSRPRVLDIANSDTPRRPKSQISFEHDKTLTPEEENQTIHPFDHSKNITVVELEKTLVVDTGEQTRGKGGGTDGSDSGVEIHPTEDLCHESVLFQRALSSGGCYSSRSSCEGRLDDTGHSENSSICSVYEDAFERLQSKNTAVLEDLARHSYLIRNDERASENGSESSIPDDRKIQTVKKRVALREPPVTPTRQSRKQKSEVTTQPARSRSKSNSKAPQSSGRIRPTTVTKVVPRTPLTTRKVEVLQPKRDTSQNRLKLGKARTPVSSPSDDGRWPSTGSKPTPITMSRAPRSTVTETTSTAVAIPQKPTRTAMLSLEIKSSALDKYATLPRRKRERTPECQLNLLTKDRLSRSRDTSLTRSFTSRTATATLKRIEPTTAAPSKFLPPYPTKRKPPKTKIYAEISSQTALTGRDLARIISGKVSEVPTPDRAETRARGVQCDIVDINEKCVRLEETVNEQKLVIKRLEEELMVEREEKIAAKEELQKNAQRIVAMLQPVNEGSNDEGCDSLLTLESQFKKAGEIVIKQEQEISELHSLCRSLQRQLQKTLEEQQTLMQHHNNIELETMELKEFMQAEKTTLAEVLKDTEDDVRLYIEKLKQADLKLRQQQDECKHLVRMSEQRRQENLTLQARLGCLESRTRELLLQQGAAVSGAAVALSGLIGRLESLVTQLVESYNISEQDLEDAIYHNEAYSNSESSEGSPVKSASSLRSKRTPSPKRGASFVSAVITAIRNAAASTAAIRANSISQVTDSEDTDSGELLDSETEPVLMMENVLEDVTLPDTHSVNMVSSMTSSMMSSTRLGQSSESLNNLSQSILVRQRQERQLNEKVGGPVQAFTLVDQVIDVDNMLTKLLKVLRIIQIDNDSYVNELQEERNQLTEQIEQQQIACKAAVQQLKEWEIMGARLKAQVTDVNKQIESKTKELTEAKTEILQQRNEIDRLNEDICKLSVLCSQTEKKLRHREDEATATLKQWQETGKLPKADVLARLVTARHEIPALKEQLKQKEKELGEMTEKFSTSKQVMTDSWNQAITETRRQYDAIDSALETLLGIQNVVEQCPPLSELQRNLEEINFQCASTIPIVPSDFNANAAAANNHPTSPTVTPINGTA